MANFSQGFQRMQNKMNYKRFEGNEEGLYYRWKKMLGSRRVQMSLCLSEIRQDKEWLFLKKYTQKLSKPDLDFPKTLKCFLKRLEKKILTFLSSNEKLKIMSLWLSLLSYFKNTMFSLNSTLILTFGLNLLIKYNQVTTQFPITTKLTLLM